MGSFADFLENELLDHVFGAAAYTAPVTLHIGLSTTAVADDGTGITEPGNGYARVAVTNNLTNFPAAAAGAKSNGIAIVFPAATGSWGTITDFFISDAAGGGNILARGQISAATPVVSGETIEFAIGDLDITLD